MPAATASATVVLLAGGSASRFPGKLERELGGTPLVVGAYERFRADFPVVISANAPFAPAIAARLICPIVADERPGGGPLAGMIAAFAAVATPLAIVVAADLPHAEATLARELLAAREPGDEAVVPEHERGIEPLCALYEIAAFARSAPDVLRESGAVRDVLARLRVRRVAMAADRFLNINSPADWDRAVAGQGVR